MKGNRLQCVTATRTAVVSTPRVRSLAITTRQFVTVVAVCTALMLPGPAGAQARPQEKAPPAELGRESVTLDNAAWTLAFSPDGKWLASGTMRGLVTVWELATLKVARTLEAKGLMGSVTFSPDGKTLAFTSKDRLTLIDVATGQETVSISGSHLVRFSPRGDLLAFGNKGASGDITLRELNTGKERKLRGHLNPISSLSFSPDGRLLASGGNDNTARIWDVSTGAQIQQFEGGGLFIAGVTFAPDGKLLAYITPVMESGGSGRFKSTGGRVVLRDVATWAETQSINTHSLVSDLPFAPDGKTLAFGDGGTVKLWNVQTNSQVNVFPAPSATCLAFSPDGSILAHNGEQKITLLRVTAKP
jgi:Tol biopolymer transport system component